MKMKFGNQKGFTGLEIVLIGAFIGLVIVPLVRPWIPGLSGGDGQKTTKKQITTVSTVPYVAPDGHNAYVVDSQGNKTPMTLHTETTSTDDEVIVPKTPWYKKLLALPLIYLILMGAALIGIPGAGFLLTRTNAALKTGWDTAEAKIKDWEAKHQNLMTEAQKIVLSVDDGMATIDHAIEANVKAAALIVDPVAKSTLQAVSQALTDAKKAFVSALGHTQDGSTDVLVTQLKQTAPTPPPTPTAPTT